jgi:hypothetical protein
MLEKQGGSVDLVVLASSRTFQIDESEAAPWALTVLGPADPAAVEM